MQLLSKEYCLDFFFFFFFCTKASLMNNKNFCKPVSSCVSFFLLVKDLVEVPRGCRAKRRHIPRCHWGSGTEWIQVPIKLRVPSSLCSAQHGCRWKRLAWDCCHSLPWTNTTPGVRQQPRVAIAALRRPEGLLDTGLPC